MQIAICDDRIEQIVLMKEFLADYKSIYTSMRIEVFSDAKEMWNKIINGSRYDIIFLDIEIEDINGIDLAQDIRKIDKKVEIIFASSYPKYITMALETNPFQFLIKPLDKEDFSRQFERAVQKIKDNNKTYSIRFRGEQSAINLDNIIFIEARHKHLEIHVIEEKKERVIDIVGQIGKEEERLSSYGFLRIHRGFIVNMRFIKSIGQKDVTCKTGHTLPMSIKKRKEVMTRFNFYISEMSV